MSEKNPVPSPQRENRPTQEAGGASGQGGLLPIKTLAGMLRPKPLQTGYGSDLAIQGVAAMDPANKATYSVFASGNPKQKAKRDLLRARLTTWIKHLEAASGADGVIAVLNKEVDQLQKVLDGNLQRFYSKLSESGLERSYRELDLLFENAKSDPSDVTEKEVWIINQDAEGLGNKDFINRVGAYIEDRAMDFTLSEAFSLMVVPGLLTAGGEDAVNAYARICSKYQVQLFSDFHDKRTPQEVVEEMDGDLRELRGSGNANLHKRAVSLVANYLLGRPKNRFEEAVQGEDVWLRPSLALAGVTYAMDGGKGMQQPGAGIEHGRIRGVKALRFKLNTVTAGQLEGRNIIPVCLFAKEPVFMGASTLFTGEIHNIYSNRRTLDYVSKNIKDFLNRVTFQTIDPKLLDGIQQRVRAFMDDLCKKGMIAKVDSVDIIATPEMKKRFEVQVSTQFTPLFPVKYFNLEVSAAGQGKKAFKDGGQAG